ncbi:MAG: HAD-IA family hydrolase [Nitrososphaeria archaeon]|nr:HAD-IA family hydrolase [Nitrososphaeria archaeon]NIN52666.1 HAD-IA family hydrolase [Nitrososphaeria archaeon]NIQ33141.1 HAD-IA family hydrolase [Nitrososphaeria archaeon]
MIEAEVVSFDLDGTLIDHVFTDSVWFEGIPRLYVEREKIPLKEAREIVKREYDEVGMERLEWYDVKYWLKRFDLGEDWWGLLNQYRSKIRLYPEVPNVLEKLRGYDLVMITNSPREFLSIELEETRIGNYFKNIFSSTSDFGQVKKTTDFYVKVSNILGIPPQRIAHVGDNWIFDFVIPREIGIKSFYLNRKGERGGEYVVRDLKEFMKKLQRIK